MKAKLLIAFVTLSLFSCASTGAGSGSFDEYSVKELVAEIESVLGNEIAEKYDI